MNLPPLFYLAPLIMFLHYSLPKSSDLNTFKTNPRHHIIFPLYIRNHLVQTDILCVWGSVTPQAEPPGASLYQGHRFQQAPRNCPGTLAGLCCTLAPGVGSPSSWLAHVLGSLQTLCHLQVLNLIQSWFTSCCSVPPCLLKGCQKRK